VQGLGVEIYVFPFEAKELTDPQACGDGQHVEGLEAVAAGGLKELLGLFGVQGMYLLRVRLRRRRGLADVAGYNPPLDRLLQRPMQDAVHQANGAWSQARHPQRQEQPGSFDPPGTAKINCSLSGDFQYRYASFKVVEGDSGYKSLELECKSGAEARFVGTTASGAGSKFELVSYRDLVDEAREYFKKGLEEGDVVEAAGYPEDPNPTVRVVRNGKVIATVEFSPLNMYATYCPGQI
jgi:hypothetical protein